METLSADAVLARLKDLNPKRPYKAMYSTLFGGIVTDPALMIIPIDDHIVHRGDGVFEAIRVTPKGMYLIKPHLERLFRSAQSLAMRIPHSIEEIESICQDLIIAAGKPQSAMLRLFVGRGPGDFSPNPYTTIGSQLYILIMDYAAPSKEKYESGASLMISKVPVKHAPYVQIKSCNYLHNVMMKKESVDEGFDFSVGLTDGGFVAEGPTENMAIVDRYGDLVAPPFDYTLRGTTLIRAIELAEKMKGSLVRDVRMANTSVEDLKQAREIMMIGTTLAALGVTRFEREPVGDGRPGPVTKQLCQILLDDMGVR